MPANRIFDDDVLKASDKYSAAIQGAFDKQKEIQDEKDKAVEAKISRVSYIGYFVATLFTIGLILYGGALYFASSIFGELREIRDRITVIETERRIEKSRNRIN